MTALFDTHTHFDVEDFADDRQQIAQSAWQHQVRALVLAGFLQSRFVDLYRTQQQLNTQPYMPHCFVAPGLHPFYIEEHQPQHLDDLANCLQQYDNVAVGEIGLDRFMPEHKTPQIQQLQQDYFKAQLALAQQFNKPVILHIRKAHGEVIQILRQMKFSQGGIAHAFSGGEAEAKTLVKMGFKIGITGQITNPNAKKLQRVVRQLSLADMVIETDCPDMTPLPCQKSTEHKTRNQPDFLPYVLAGLSEQLAVPSDILATQLWKNSCQALFATDDLPIRFKSSEWK